MGPQTTFGVIVRCSQSSWTSVAQSCTLRTHSRDPVPSLLPLAIYFCPICSALPHTRPLQGVGRGLVTLSQINLFLQLYLSLGAFYTSLLAFVFSPGFQHDISDFFWKIGKCFRCLILNRPKLEYLEITSGFKGLHII